MFSEFFQHIFNVVIFLNAIWNICKYKFLIYVAICCSSAPPGGSWPYWNGPLKRSDNHLHIVAVMRLNVDASCLSNPTKKKKKGRAQPGSVSHGDTCTVCRFRKNRGEPFAPMQRWDVFTRAVKRYPAAVSIVLSGGGDAMTDVAPLAAFCSQAGI